MPVPVWYLASWRVVCLVALLIVSGGCGRPSNESAAASPETSSEDSQTPSADPPAVRPDAPPAALERGAKGVALAGLHNVLLAANRLICGSEPHGDEGFKSLADMGVKVVVSVDGAQPDIEAAQRHGLRYVHIPIGYDGVHAEASAALARVVRELEGPIYIHCHHGQHRGPAAAAVAAIAAGELSSEQAQEILKRAGTDPNYKGLWRDVAAFTPPAEGAPLPELVESAKVDSFAAAMSQIDRSYDNLKLINAARWSVPPDHPDLVPAHEALILYEGLRETSRNLTEGRDDRFKTWLNESAESAQLLETAVRQMRSDVADRQMESLRSQCKRCHEAYRN